MDPAQSPLDHAELFGRLVQRKLTLTEFACEVVLATNHSSEYCSKLQKHLDAQACVRRIAAPPQNETDHTLSVRVFKCLRIWNMAFQIQEDSHKAHTGKKSRSTMRIEAEKFAAESFDITTLETRKLNFLCLIGSCGLLPMPLEEFNELYKKVPDGHEQGAVIRTRIQKYIKGSHLPFLSWEKAEKRGFSDLDDGECAERTRKRTATSELLLGQDFGVSWDIIDCAPEFDLHESLYGAASDNHSYQPA